MADLRPRIHIWPDSSAGSSFVHWSIGPSGIRHLVRSAGVGVDQALQELGPRAAGGFVIIGEPGAGPAAPANVAVSFQEAEAISHG